MNTADDRTPECQLWEDALGHFQALVLFVKVASGCGKGLLFENDCFMLRFWEDAKR